MTDEQLDERESALIEVKQLLAEGKGTINGPLVNSLVDNEIRLITALRSERTAHQSTKAKLHAAGLMVSVACDIFSDPTLDKSSYREAFWKYKRRYDAIRAGQCKRPDDPPGRDWKRIGGEAK